MKESKMSKSMKKFIDTLEKANVKIVFGLENQGHIPTIKKMLKQKKSWTEIGDVINWCPKTAEKCYKEYLNKQVKELG